MIAFYLSFLLFTSIIDYLWILSSVIQGKSCELMLDMNVIYTLHPYVHAKSKGNGESQCASDPSLIQWSLSSLNIFKIHALNFFIILKFLSYLIVWFKPPIELR
jgi:hypothetical protein